LDLRRAGCFFEKLMQTEQAAEAMKYDGVRPETLVILSAG